VKALNFHETIRQADKLAAFPKVCRSFLGAILIMVKIVKATAEESIEGAKTLIRDYVESLEFDLDFQNFGQEMDDFPGEYALPKGRLYIAIDENQPVGCVALRDLGDGICEMKRLYVNPEYRGRHIGRVLAKTVIKAAGELGYDRMRLDTIPSMRQANVLYKSLGFKEITPYRFNPIEGATFFELKLKESSFAP
jgi:putative acetyltransferase